jgi:hypothetical protein
MTTIIKSKSFETAGIGIELFKNEPGEFGVRSFDTDCNETIELRFSPNLDILESYYNRQVSDCEKFLD